MESPTSSKVHVATKHQQRFMSHGFVHLKQAIPVPMCVSMRAAFAAHFQPVFPQPSAPSRAVTGATPLPLHALAGAFRPVPSTHASVLDFGADPHFAAFDAALQTALDAVFSEGAWCPAPTIGRLIMPAFPMNTESWDVPRDAWHADEPTFLDRDTPMGILAFVFLDDVRPKGGATVVLSGSPRLLQKVVQRAVQEDKPHVLQCHEALEVLRNETPSFAALLNGTGSPEEREQRFMNTSFSCMGMPIRVEELTGAMGDIVLMDPRALHTISPNCSDRARLVAKLCAQRG